MFARWFDLRYLVLFRNDTVLLADASSTYLFDSFLCIQPSAHDPQMECISGKTFGCYTSRRVSLGHTATTALKPRGSRVRMARHSLSILLAEILAARPFPRPDFSPVSRAPWIFGLQVSPRTISGLQPSCSDTRSARVSTPRDLNQAPRQPALPADH